MTTYRWLPGEVVTLTYTIVEQVSWIRRRLLTFEEIHDQTNKLSNAPQTVDTNRDHG